MQKNLFGFFLIVLVQKLVPQFSLFLENWNTAVHWSSRKRCVGELTSPDFKSAWGLHKQYLKFKKSQSTFARKKWALYSHNEPENSSSNQYYCPKQLCIIPIYTLVNRLNFLLVKTDKLQLLSKHRHISLLNEIIAGVVGVLCAKLQPRTR